MLLDNNNTNMAAFRTSNIGAAPCHLIQSDRFHEILNLLENELERIMNDEVCSKNITLIGRIVVGW